MNIPSVFWIVPFASVCALIMAFYFYKSMMREDEGTERMREVAGYVRTGAMAYLGDFAILSARRLSPQSITGVDISEGMMQIGRQKVKALHLDGIIRFQHEDCEALSFADDTFDAVTVAYGVRNFEHLDQGLREMCRVLKPGGHLLIIELSSPHRFPMKQLFSVYAKIVMPLIGRLISKDHSAYSYLPATMAAFPQGEVMQVILRKAGFGDVRFKRFTFGISTMYLATK